MRRCENIVAGATRPAGGYRAAAAWELPQTQAHDVAFALKCMNVEAPIDVGAVVDALASIGRQGDWLGGADLREIAAATGFPVRYLRGAVDRLNSWLAELGRYVASLGVLDRAGGLRRPGGIRLAGGLRTTVVLAGNEPTLAPWVISHLLLAQARAVIKPSNVEPVSTALFMAALERAGCPRGALPHVLHFDSASEVDRRQIKRLVACTDQSVVFGEDATVAAIYADLPFAPAHRALPYWTGRSATIVLPGADLADAARVIVAGATTGCGNQCISTKRTLAPRGCAAELERLLIAAADRLTCGGALDEATDYGVLAGGERAMAERLAADGEVLYDRGLLLARATRDECALLCDEVPYPIVGLRYYAETDDPVAIANAAVARSPSRRAMVVTVCARERDEFLAVAERLAAFKVLWNQPTTHFDHFAPHQARHLCLDLMRESFVGS